MTDPERVQLLQRMVDTFATDINVVRSCLAEGRAPEPALRALAASLIYVVDRQDLVPDNLAGIGIADDAAVLRLAAKVAVKNGADDAALRRLAAEAVLLGDIYGSLVWPLEDYLDRLQWDARFGKPPLELLRDPEMGRSLWKELGQRVGDHRSTPLNGGAQDGSANFILVMRKLIKVRLKTAGIT